MLEFIPFSMKLLDTEDKSICPKSSPIKRGDTPNLGIDLFSCEVFYSVAVEPKYKSRLKDDEQGLSPWNLPDGIQLLPALRTRKIQMNSNPASLRFLHQICSGQFHFRARLCFNTGHQDTSEVGNIMGWFHFRNCNSFFPCGHTQE